MFIVDNCFALLNTVTRLTSSKKTAVESHDPDMVGNGESRRKGAQVTRNGNFEFMQY